MICLHLNLSFFISCCGPPTGTLKQKIFPVFKPNEYFWKKHWEPVKDKEDKASVYCRVIRSLMIHYGGFKDTHHTAEARFEYLKAYRGVDHIDEE